MFCRICLVEHTTGLPIFDEYRGEFLPGIVRTIAGVEIIPGDGLPENVCYECAHILLQAHDIRKRCLESDAVLHAKVLTEQHSQDSLQKIESEKNIFIWETIIQTYEPPPPVLPPPVETTTTTIDNLHNTSLDASGANWSEDKEDNFSDVGSDRDIGDLDNDNLNDTDGHEIYKCAFCPKKFSSKTRYHRHNQYHRQKKAKCQICGNEFTHKSNLKRHMLLHEYKEELKCDQCEAVFYDSNEHYEHVKNHIKNETYIHECAVCGQQTKSVATYLAHMKKEHDTIIERPFKCLICSMHFKSKQGLYRHVDNIHEAARKNLKANANEKNGEKNLLCPTCGKKFPDNFHLQVHVRTHTLERPFKCSECPKSFAQASGLKMHTFTHTGEKPFACRVCGKRFNQYAHVREHLRTHANEKPHVCKICNKSFRVKGNLTAHMATHTGEKPFTCDVCGKSYAQSKKLRTHFAKVHRKQQPPAEEES